MSAINHKQEIMSWPKEQRTRGAVQSYLDKNVLPISMGGVESSHLIYPGVLLTFGIIILIVSGLAHSTGATGNMKNFFVCIIAGGGITTISIIALAVLCYFIKQQKNQQVTEEELTKLFKKIEKILARRVANATQNALEAERYLKQHAAAQRRFKAAKKQIQ